MSKPFDYANGGIADFIEREQYDQRLVSESDFLRAAQAAFDDVGKGASGLREGDERAVGAADGEMCIGMWRERMTLHVTNDCFDSATVYLTPEEARKWARAILTLVGEG
jgi:hypothetical protein